MRTALLLLLTLAFYPLGSTAQRPWIFAFPTTTNQVRLETVSGILYSYSDLGTSYSIDHGRTWVTVGSLGTDVHAMSDFIPGVSLAIWHGSKSDSARIYFTSNGTVWSLSENLWLGGGLPSCLTANGQQFYIGTSGIGGKIFVRGVTFDSIAVGSAGDILDLKVTDTFIAAATTVGVQISTDNGASWSTSNPPQSGADVPSSLLLHYGDLLAPSSMGVYKYNLSSKNWSAVGTWPDSVTNRSVLALAGDPQRLLAIVRNATGKLQMYRLQTGDTAWIETAYPLPHSDAVITPKMLIIDNGWSVINHRSTSATDTLGIYNYDLNDFTSVDESDNADVIIRTSGSSLEIITPFTSGFTVSIYDLLGNLLLSSSTNSQTYSTTNTKSYSETYTKSYTQSYLVLTTNDGRIHRRIIHW